MNKTAIKNFAVWAREKLIQDITHKAKMIGISEMGILEPLPQSTEDLKFFDIGLSTHTEILGKDVEKREVLVQKLREKEQEMGSLKEALDVFVEEIAYTWFNRLIAIRFMEVNDYLPSGVRVLSSEIEEKKEPDLVTNPFEADLDLTEKEKEKIFELKEKNLLDELFRLLFLKQCNKLHEVLPHLFEKIDDYSELLLTLSFTDSEGIVAKLVALGENDFDVTKEGQVEIIGWMYQYYNVEPKNKVFARKKGERIKKEQIPAATQLFTPDWIVRYMVENSLGRLWYEGHLDNKLKDKWNYYIDESKQEAEVEEKLNDIRKEYSSIRLEELKFIDPCMGSGHILVYAFEVLMQIYLSNGYTERDAVASIIENNLFGLDLDERATQLSYFAIMMKGREYDRRFFTRNIAPNIFDVPDMVEISSSMLGQFGEYKEIAKNVFESFRDGKELGSLLQPLVTMEELEKLSEKIKDMKTEPEDMVKQYAIKTIMALVKISRILVQKYDVVVTNPPYMAVSNLGTKLNEYIKKNYPDSKMDLFAVFIERCMEMLKENRMQAMITMHSWMFLSTFESLRKKLLRKDIINMVHLGARAFEEIGGEVVQTTSFVIRNSLVEESKGTYYRLVEPNTEKGKEEMFLRRENRHETERENFEKIPGSIVAYWVKERMIEVFKQCRKFNGDTKKGVMTGNNTIFLRSWSEVSIEKIGFQMNSHSEMIMSKKKWFPVTAGGLKRKWYGNFDTIVNLENDGMEIRRTVENYRLRDIKYYMREAITWTEVSSGIFSCRFVPKGILFGNGGPVSFFDSDELYYHLGLLNSSVTMSILEYLAPTVNYGPEQISKVPLLVKFKDIVDKLVNNNIHLSRIDWDSYETSWDFVKHPLLRSTSLLSEAYEEWKTECNTRFTTLKANEEELNRIFIDIYGLRDEMTSEVEDKDVTVHYIFDTKEDVTEEMKGSAYVRTKREEILSLISYAVGCMLGRYSLDTEGLAFAGGVWDISKYRSFEPDEDNCIPITDETYFTDDIVGRFEEFVKVVYGNETLEKNLDFIATALGNKGGTSREVIRKYFLNDFIKDHNKTYQKRPIYWLFDSGKQNGFKALCYMHRWTEDTIGNMRVEYLHRMQRVYEKELIRMGDIIKNSGDNKEIALATKRKEKLIKQLKETKDYDALIAHLALSRIAIDLDDGVKVNHEKVQTGTDGKKMEVLERI